MISGTCPYRGCKGMVWLPIADAEKCPCYQKHTCEKCKRVIWTKHSRWDPCSWTERNFLKKFKVNKKTKEITERHPPKPLTKKEKVFKALVDEMLHKMVMDQMIYGVGFKYVPKWTRQEKPK